MTDFEIIQVMLDCKLLPVDVQVDDAGLIQFARELIKSLKEEHACLVERMGIDGYGTLYIAAAIRAMGE